MKYSVRNYRPTDYPMLVSWAGGRFAPEERIPAESSFVLLKNNEPVMAITVILTNTDLAWFENLIGSPSNRNRPGALRLLIQHAIKFSKQAGKKNVFLMSIRRGTDRIWKDYGFEMGCGAVKTFVRGTEVCLG